MLPLNDPKFDAVTALVQGGRDYQEDAIVADFPLGTDHGMVVLADGMGGHAAGDIASKIVMTEVYSELKFQSSDPGAFARHLPEILRNAALAANDCVLAHISENPEARGMGATLVAAVVLGDRLYWISVGDSPLYLFRDGELTQLNEDHSMAPQIDLMAERGMISAEDAMYHPDRNALTSVLAGDDIPRIDCPSEGLRLRDGDIVVVASDGLQFLEDYEIEEVLAVLGPRGGTAVAREFLARIADLDDPDQDNTSIGVVRVHLPAAGAEESDEPEEDGVERADNVEVLTFGEEDEVRPRRVSAESGQLRDRPPQAEAH